MNIENFIDNAITEIRNKIKQDRAVAACSGGVDSTVTALLVSKATSNFACYFIDDGLMRDRDYTELSEELAKFNIKARYINYADKFFSELKGKYDAEDKRKAFRSTFYDTLLEIIKKEKAKWLAQGTIKPDIDETKAGIKTQHNVLEQIGLKYKFKLIEPLASLYKHEVREIAEYFSMQKLAERMPFPGPGLATRVEGEVTREKISLIRQAHEIVEEEVESALKEGELKEIPFQVFPILLESKATCIKENKRFLSNIIMLRSIQSKDAVTAETTEIPYSLLKRICKRITNELPIKRLCYDITDKPPATIEII